MIAIFAKYRVAEANRVEAWNRVFAAPSDKIQKALMIEAEQASNELDAINRQIIKLDDAGKLC